MDALCPACHVPMNPCGFLGINLDVCGECAGIWFDDGELRALADAAPQALGILDELHTPVLEVLDVPGRSKKCPRCQVRLESFRYGYDSNVRIDGCPEGHGVFVEDQELDGILKAMDAPQRRRLDTVVASRGLLAAQGIGGKAPDASISAALHALRHWRDRMQP